MTPRVHPIEPRPIHRIPYRNAARGGGTEGSVLELVTAPCDGIDAPLLVASDLQGVAPSWVQGGASVLLGIALAEQLELLAGDGRIEPLSGIDAVLAGDLYTVPLANKRGGFGDVTDVWRAFAARFRNVVGVAGNHDGFGSETAQHRLASTDNVHLLDGDLSDVGGLRVAGVSYVIGASGKPGRRDEGEQIGRIELVLGETPDILVLHEGPTDDEGQRGSALVRQAIDAGVDPSRPPLVICGHRKWERPLSMIAGGVQVLNVDARAVLLVPTSQGA